jgi:hypothetical protein
MRECESVLFVSAAFYLEISLSLTEEPLGSAILATVFLSILICFIPLVFAEKRSSPQPGTTADADFWFLPQTLLMHMLSLLITLVPVYGKASELLLWPRLWKEALPPLGLFECAVPLLLCRCCCAIISLRMPY